MQPAVNAEPSAQEIAEVLRMMRDFVNLPKDTQRHIGYIMEAARILYEFRQAEESKAG